MVVYKTTIHWKTFVVHQVHAIMYCTYTRQMIQGENFRDWLKNRENRESFPLISFAVYSITQTNLASQSICFSSVGSSYKPVFIQILHNFEISFYAQNKVLRHEITSATPCFLGPVISQDTISSCSMKYKIIYNIS